MSRKTRADCSAEILSRTATRCTILLNLSTKTRIPVFFRASLGKPKIKSIDIDFQQSDATGNERKGAC